MSKEIERPAMWLYPINKKSADFTVGKETSALTGRLGFSEMIDRGGRDDVWGIATNFKNVQVGDQIVVYASKTSKEDPKLIGIGRVIKGPYEKDTWDTPLIKIKWNIRVSKRLGAAPLDARWLAKYLPVTKSSVTTIPPKLWPKLREKIFGDERAPRAAVLPASLHVATLRDIMEVNAASWLRKTTMTQLIQARLGQGLFKRNVGKIEKGCRITGVTNQVHLRASHIKPWHAASNQERLDGNNGLLLAPHVDHLFDRGFISFRRSGEMLVSSKLPKLVLRKWSIDTSRNVGRFSSDQEKYLKHHRRYTFQA